MVITLKEQLTIQQVRDLKDLLQRELAVSRLLTVDLTEARQVDTAFLQLLCAVRAAAQRDKKNLTLRLADEPDCCFRKACQAAGLERLYQECSDLPTDLNHPISN